MNTKKITVAVYGECTVEYVRHIKLELPKDATLSEIQEIASETLTGIGNYEWESEDSTEVLETNDHVKHLADLADDDQVDGILIRNESGELVVGSVPTVDLVNGGVPQPDEAVEFQFSLKTIGTGMNAKEAWADACDTIANQLTEYLDVDNVPDWEVVG